MVESLSNENIETLLIGIIKFHSLNLILVSFTWQIFKYCVIGVKRLGVEEKWLYPELLDIIIIMV